MKAPLFLLAVMFLTTACLAQPLETVIQRGHELMVLCAAADADSTYVVTGSRDKSAKLWELRSGREVRTLAGHDASVTAVAFLPGERVVTGSNDKSIRVWDATTGRTLHQHRLINQITSITVDPQARFFAVGGYNMTGRGDSIHIFDAHTYRLLHRIKSNPQKGSAKGVYLSTSSDGKWLAIGEDDLTIRLFETSQWQLVQTYRSSDYSYCGGCASRALFTPDSRFIYTVADRGRLLKHAVGDTAVVLSFGKAPEDVTAFAQNAAGGWLAIAEKNQVQIFRAHNGSVMHTISADASTEFRDASFSGSHTLLITTSTHKVLIVDVVSGRVRGELTGYLNQRDRGGLTYNPESYWESYIARYVRYKNQLLVSRDGRSLIKGKFGTLVKRWDIATGQTLREYAGHSKAVLCYALSRDGKRLLTGGGDGKIILWDVVTGDTLRTIRAYREPVFDVQFDAEETAVASCSWDASLRIHDLQTGRQLHYHDLGQQSAYQLLFHPNNQYLITAQLDYSLRFYEIDTKKIVRDFIGHTDIVSSIRLRDDRQKLLSASWDGSVRLWDVASGLLDRKYAAGTGPVHVTIFSADQQSIYTAGADRTIRQWEVATGRILRTWHGHQAEITSLALRPDGSMLMSHSLDGATKFWDPKTGLEFFEHIHLGERDWLVKNPEGYFSGTAGARAYIHFVEGNQTFGVEQFFDQYYRPDLLPRLFHNRSSGDKKSVGSKLRQAPPPTVQLNALKLPGDEAELFVTITCQGAAAELLRLFHNGKNIPIKRSELLLPSKNGESTTYSQVIALVPGVNVFSAIVRDRDRVESSPVAVEVESERAAVASVCHLLAVGINVYKNPTLSLNYARPDAEAFARLVTKGNGLFAHVHLHTLFDQDASRTNILQKLDEIAAQARPEDVFVFYYAGHGSLVENEFYFVPSESIRLYEAGALSREAIDASTLQKKLQQIKSLKQLIVMDACQSGSSVERLATRGALEEKAIAQLSRSAGIHVMASAGSTQLAAEFDELGHGLFTYVLVEALGGAADGSPKDGKVTIYELKSYLDDQVPELTRKLKGKPQYPFTFSRGQDFPIRLGQ